MKYKELGYKKNFVIANFMDLGKDTVDIRNYKFIYSKREHHSIIYKLKDNGERVFYGCRPIDSQEEVIQID